MKTSNVSPASAAASATPVKGPAAPTAGDATDFLSLFTQVVEGAVPAVIAPATLVAAALPVETAVDQDDAGSDLDESEVAMMLAALTGAPVMPATSASLPPRDAGNADPLQAGSRTRELTGVMVEMLASPATPAGMPTLDVPDTQGSSADPLLANPDVSGNPAPLDPRLIDAMRDVRGPLQSDAPVQRHMQTPVGTRAWADELGSQINWMTERGHQAASLRLSPEHLGPLEIRISIQDDGASVWFGAAHADTRAAIEGALPRLREMLASQGLALNDAGVFKEAPRQQPQFRSERDGNGGESGGGAADVQSVSVSRLGLVDAYA